MAKRKAFNFYESYFDVFFELPKKDRLPFMEALLLRQFKGIEPDNLEGMAKFAYISQKRSIDTQVKGWEDKTGCKLSSSDPYEGGCKGGRDTSTEQEKGEEKGEEKDKGEEQEVRASGGYSFEYKYKYFIGLFNKLSERNFRGDTKSKSQFKARLNENYTSTDFAKAITNALKDDYHRENNLKYLTPEYITRANMLEKWLNIKEVKLERLNKEDLAF